MPYIKLNKEFFNMQLIYAKCYKLVENPLIMLFCFNISLPPPLFQTSYTHNIYLLIICIFFFFIYYIMIHVLMKYSIDFLYFKCMLVFNRRPRGRLVITPNESPSQNLFSLLTNAWFILHRFQYFI